jgi:hypothetical protein
LPDCPPPEWHMPLPVVPTMPPRPMPYPSVTPNVINTEEKYYFGKGALILCLTIIGILSMTTAMFIGLYIDKL